jgi:hypothetical protein
LKIPSVVSPVGAFENARCARAAGVSLRAQNGTHAPLGTFASQSQGGDPQMKKPELAPHEKAELDKKREGQGPKQLYASEIDDRELERAHKESRPVNPRGGVKSDPSR